MTDNYDADNQPAAVEDHQIASYLQSSIFNMIFNIEYDANHPHQQAALEDRLRCFSLFRLLSPLLIIAQCAFWVLCLPSNRTS